MRQNKNAQKEMLEEIEQVDGQFYNLFQGIISSLSEIELTREDIQNIVENDIESAFQIPMLKEKFKSFEEVYNRIEIKVIPKAVEQILKYFGIGSNYPQIFENIFTQYIFNDVEWKDFRVFTEFSSKDLKRFRDYLCRKKPQLVVCIVDNQLGQNECAKEIINVIKENGKDNDRFVIGAIFSSTIDDGNIDNNVYFELVKKEEPSKLQSAIVCSGYSYILKKLEYTYVETLKEAFENAVKNRNIAFYLSNMASTEGITNYQVITEWIKLIFDWKLSENQELYKMLRFTKLINLLDEGEMETHTDLKKIDIFEAFDLNVNRYSEPIASGDIFIVNEKGIDEKIYILLGQDCDMMYSPERPVKNGISELVEAEAVCQIDIGKEVEQNRQNIRISNFPKDNNQTRTLEIKYTSRKYIDNQILNLCQFNEAGECKINLEQKLNDEKMIMPDYYMDLYTDLQNYFSAIEKLKNASGESLEIMLNSNQSPRIIKLHEYNIIENNTLKYPIRRLGRLRSPYTLFLYKMYLEYRGRHPFNTINMSRLQEGIVEVEGDENKKINITYMLSPDRTINRKDSRKLVWIIKTENINVLLKDIDNENGELNDKTENIYLDKIVSPYDKQFQLSTGKTLIITKRKKGKMSLEIRK